MPRKLPPTEYAAAVVIGTPAEVEAALALKLADAAAIVFTSVAALSTRIHDAAYDRNVAAERIVVIVIYTVGTVEP